MIDKTNYDFFASEEEEKPNKPTSDSKFGKKILIVDDEEDIHVITKMTMEDFIYEGSKIEILSAYSAQEAINIIKSNEDISLVLLDIVMETQSAGFDVVNYIRKELNNNTIRIILLTGQPGLLSGHQIIDKYDIDGYHTKTDLTSDKLYFAVKTGLRTFSLIKDTEEKLRLSDLRYKRMYEKSPLPFQSLDFDGKIIDINPKWLETTGYEREDVVGRNFGDFLDTQSLTNFSNNFAVFKNEGHIDNVDFRIRKKDGSHISILLEGDIGEDESGGIIRTYCVFKDISNELKFEKALHKSEEKFRFLAENSMDIIWTTDTKLRFTYVSPAANTLLGYNTEEVLGTHLSNYFTKKEFIKAGGHAIAALKNYKNFTSITFESKMLNMDGKECEVEISGKTLKDENGKLLGLQGTTKGISDKKKAENIQNILYRISNAANISEDLTTFIKQIQNELGTIIDTTNFYVALYDDSKDEFILPYMSDNKATRKSFPAGKTLTKYVLSIKKSLLVTKKDIEKLEKKGVVKSGGPDSEIWLGVPLRINNQAIGVLAIQSYENEIAYNISDLKMLEFVSDQISTSIYRKKTEEDLQNQNDELEALNIELTDSIEHICDINEQLEISKRQAVESDLLKSAFLANMSHEIRTPMNGILGFTNLLSKPGITNAQREQYIDIIRKSGDRMLHTVNDLMDISMIEAGQMKVVISDADINNQCITLVNFFKPEANNKGIELATSSLLTQSDTLIRTDSEKTYAVISNLIKNAIKYSHRGKIEVGCSRKKDFIELFVKDTGIGIAIDRQKAVFDRFVQADIEDKAALEGSGLGLSISKAYIEMLGGSIWLKSKEGKGSTFFFTIPFSPSMEITNQKETNKEINDPKLDPQKLKVLIAEDEIFAYEYLSIVLKVLNPVLLHAHSGEEAINLCKSNSDIDLILMDIKMPGIDGYKATKEIRKFNDDVVIIAQTAYALLSDKSKAIQAGCNDYISKPVDKDILLAMVKKYIKI